MTTSAPLSLLRRASCLVAWWADDGLTLENYLSGRQTVVHPYLLRPLTAFERPVRRSDALDRLGVPDADELLVTLVEQDILLPVGSELEKQDGMLAETWVWGHEVRYFHFAARRVIYEEDTDLERASLAELARRHPPPPPWKDYGRSDALLPSPSEDSSAGLWHTLSRRRTQRKFPRTDLSSQQLSTILYWTWGTIHKLHDPEVGPFVLKTSPSGGARHPIEVYPLIMRVTGVEPGLYHYCFGRHTLTCLQAGDLEDLAVRCLAGQPWVADASAVFFMTAVLDRSWWKYKQSHAYRVLLLDAGHLAQTFHLACTALDLAPFTSAAMREDLVEQSIGLDGISEIAIYAAAVGPLQDG